MPPTGKTKERRDDIQILRAIAVLAVIVFHLEKSALPGGYLGVDIFFVISGFLITGIITRSLNRGTFSLSDFYLRRIKRLFPALSLTLLGTLILGIISLPPIPFRGLMEHLPWAALQVSNFSFMREAGYFDPTNETNPVLHTWSLGVEEQYYATWAPILLLCYFLFKKYQKSSGDFQPRSVLFVIIISSLFLEYVTVNIYGETVSFFSPISRAWQLALGGLGATFVAQTSRQIVSKRIATSVALSSVFIIGFSLAVIPPEASSQPLWRAIPCLGTLLILIYPVNLSAPQVTFIKKPAVYLGDISYSLYLWHWPAICLTPYLINSHTPILNLAFSLAFTFLAASASYHWCEMRFIQSQKWDRLISFRSSNAIAILCIIAGGAFALQTEEDSSWRFDGGKKSLEEKSWIVPPQFRDYPEDSSLPYENVSSSQVVLIGDSHARHFAPLVDRWATDRNLTFNTFWGTGTFCLGTNAFIESLDELGNPTGINDTTKLSRALLETLESNKNLEVVFIAQRTAAYTHAPLPSDLSNTSDHRMRHINDLDSPTSTREVYENQITSYIKRLREKGISVVLLGQVPPLVRAPKPGPSILDQWLNREWKEDDIFLSKEMASRLDLEYEIYEQMATLPGVYHLRSRNFLTNTYSDGYFLYDDVNHINFQGAIFFYEELENLTRTLSL